MAKDGKDTSSGSTTKTFNFQRGQKVEPVSPAEDGGDSDSGSLPSPDKNCPQVRPGPTRAVM